MSMDIDELKALAVGVITSAMSARSGLDDSSEVKLKQYANDFNLLFSSATIGDVYQVTSLLGDICAALLGVMAKTNDQDPNDLLQMLAYMIREANAERLEGDASDQ